MANFLEEDNQGEYDRDEYMGVVKNDRLLKYGPFDNHYADGMLADDEEEGEGEDGCDVLMSGEEGRLHPSGEESQTRVCYHIVSPSPSLSTY